MFKLLITILLLLSANLFAQKKDIPPPPSPIKNAKKSSDKNANYKPVLLDKRLKKFPFKNATKIEIISFNLETDEPIEVSILVSKDSIFKNNSKKENSVFVRLSTLVAQRNLEGVNQRKILTLNAIDNLTDILYNTCSKYNSYSYDKNGCYNPRNAILFYNDSGEIYEYLEICFECNQMFAEPKKIPGLQDYCNVAYTDLEAFFSKNGIETEKHNKK
ncbi:MAG TPA: hypothetical protein VF677_03905 [Flavobacterium sp.]|jgi:hypothetical protein